MAVNNPSGLTLSKQTVGQKYTKVTDSLSDWASVSNNTYFYDLADELVYYKDSTGTVVGAYNSSGGGGGGSSFGTETNSTRSLPYVMASGVTTYKSLMPMGSTTISSTTFNAESVHFFPVSLKEGNTVSTISFRVNTAGSAGLGTAEVEFGIYKATTDANGNLIPGTLEVSFGKVATNTTGVKEATLVSPHTLGTTVDGIYFVAFRNYSTATISLNTASLTDSSSSWFGFSSASAVVKLGSFFATCAYNTAAGLPATLPATGGVGFTPSTTVAGYSTFRVMVGLK